VAGIVAVVAAALGFYAWRTAQTPAPAAVDETPPAPASMPAAAAPAPSAPQYPAPVPASAVGTPEDLQRALVDLFGRDAVLSLFTLDDFARRVAATVDNLGRAQASASLGPLRPAPGRFTVQSRGDGTIIGADNALRYAPYVQLLERVDPERLVALYANIHPLVQRAYEELGYPKGRFNDRLIAVIDQLLATPEPRAALAVHLPEINSPVRPQRPWVLYQFDDPALEALPAGQKLMLRMGPENERRVKARLAEIRRLLVAQRPAPGSEAASRPGSGPAPR
jgi:hypothetical protein